MQLTLDLTLEPTSAMYGHDLGANLAGTPGWKAAESVRKNRILEAAVRYLQEGDPQNNEWFRTSSISYPPIAGFHALALLMVMQDPRLDSLTREVWTKWVPILMRFTTGENDELHLQSRLLRRAHELVPNELVSRFLELIDSENERDGHLFLAKEIETCPSG